MKNILIIGNEGYVGPVVSKHFKQNYQDCHVTGYDIGYFSHLITDPSQNPNIFVDTQHHGDVRNFPKKLLKNIDAVIYLAAISNDPMGNEFEKITSDVNFNSAIKVYEACKVMGVKSFVFASSCSVYGFTDSGIRTEDSSVNPLTAYAKSKIDTEIALANRKNKNLTITCLRFATACGFSPRLRLDLVLNDFVASAMTTKQIKILSDGQPWRPLIHVNDMARAFDWSINREHNENEEFLVVNAGSNEWNYQVFELANAVSKEFGDIGVDINENAQPDNRSYKVSFSKFKSIANNYYPLMNLKNSIINLREGLENINFNDPNFRNSRLIRLNILREHIESKRLNELLKWKDC